MAKAVITNTAAILMIIPPNAIVFASGLATLGLQDGDVYSSDQLTEGERLMRMPELDAKQRIYKP